MYNPSIRDNVSFRYREEHLWMIFILYSWDTCTLSFWSWSHAQPQWTPNVRQSDFLSFKKKTIWTSHLAVLNLKFKIQQVCQWTKQEQIKFFQFLNFNVTKEQSTSKTIEGLAFVQNSFFCEVFKTLNTYSSLIRPIHRKKF